MRTAVDRHPAPVPAGYPHRSSTPTHIHRWVWPQVKHLLPPAPGRVCDVGCGNGWASARLEALGYSVTGLDPSDEGIAIARGRGLTARFEEWGVYDATPADLRERFDAVVSLDVIEHLYFPRELARRAMELLCPGGTLILSTPYHGYVKNVALAITGRLDRHFAALRDHGHIKFFSGRTLTALLREAGFIEIAHFSCGRLPMLWKSMVVRARRPLGSF
jgi:2-polyprenyl-3-methyl-5-hydroxy-6-metoxy-1,4-benzoquinol methylase